MIKAMIQFDLLQVIGKPVYLMSNLLGRYVGLICAAC